MFHRTMLKSSLVGLLLGVSASAFAELDPELAGASIKNKTGFYLGLGARVGQAYATGGSTPGVAAFATVEPGFVARRDSWGRVEISAELGSGVMNWKEKDDAGTKATATIPAYALARVGYGWSLGDNMFNVVRVGVGPAFVNYESKTDSVTAKSDGMITGMKAQITYDLIVGMAEYVDLVGGLSFSHTSFEVGDVKIAGVTHKVDETTLINSPALHVGARFTF